MTQIEQLREWVRESDNIVFFGGAGVSTESGIPDFRSVDGLYNQHYDYPPETILSHTFYRKKPDEFYRFYRAKMLCLDAGPNAVHRKLAQWEQEGKLKAVVTQNIDGLHQAAGSKVVLELHGSVLRNYCERCGKFYGVEHIVNSEGVPTCECGGSVNPDNSNALIVQPDIDGLFTTRTAFQVEAFAKLIEDAITACKEAGTF